jgi:hypothetical protein
MVEANLADYRQLAEVQRQLAESLLKKDEGEQHSLRQARPLPRPLPRLLPRPLPCPRAAPAPRVLRPKNPCGATPRAQRLPHPPRRRTRQELLAHEEDASVVLDQLDYLQARPAAPRRAPARAEDASSFCAFECFLRI